MAGKEENSKIKMDAARLPALNADPDLCRRINRLLTAEQLALALDWLSKRIIKEKRRKGSDRVQELELLASQFRALIVEREVLKLPSKAGTKRPTTRSTPQKEW